MSQIHESKDLSDISPLHPGLGLFLKPISRLNITIHFPDLKNSLPSGGTSVSSWDIIERLKTLIAPDKFISIKTVKNTLEFVRFEGDVENKAALKSAVGRLDGKKLKVTGIKEPLKILAAEAKVPFPSKYDWDSFFRDARDMNEMKPGERPDTIHFQQLPTPWFSSMNGTNLAKEDAGVADSSTQPSEKVFRRVWEQFGEVRVVDIPILDPYRSKMKSNISGARPFTFNHDKVFEAYVQFKDYMSFVKVMDTLRGSYLCRKVGEKLYVAVVRVDFDKSKHLSVESIRAREGEVERLSGLEKFTRKRIGIEIDPKIKTALLPVKGSSKVTKSKSIKNNIEPEVSIDQKIVMEERKYLVARRKLEAIRLLDFLFARVKETRAHKMKEAIRLEKKRIEAEERRREEELARKRKMEEDAEAERKRRREEEYQSEQCRYRETRRYYEDYPREHSKGSSHIQGREEFMYGRSISPNSQPSTYYVERYRSGNDLYGINTELERAYERYFNSITKR